MFKKNRMFVIVFLVLTILSLFAISTIIAQEQEEALTVKNAVLIKTVKHTSLERALFYNLTTYKQGSSLIIEADVNLTVFNFLRDTYLQWNFLTPQQRTTKCQVVEEYIQDDFSNFDCSNSGHRTLLKDRLQNYVLNGWQIFLNEQNRGFVDVSGGHIIITIPNIQHGDRIKIGQYTIVQEYQDINLINYQTDWGADVNVTLFINDSAGWNNTVSDIWVVNNPDTNKFGANVTGFNTTQSFKYGVVSSDKIKKKSNLIYYISKTTNSRCGSVACTNEERHLFDFSDICNQRTNETDVLFNPLCEINQTDDFNLEVTFYAEYNETLGYIRIDPTITITDVSVADAILINITAENNFTHLTISDTTSPINSSNLVLYIPFDTNTSSTTVYDYSSRNDDGTINGGAFWNDSGGIIGGAFEFDGTNQHIDMADDSVTAGATILTISVWVKAALADDNEREFLHVQGANALFFRRTNFENYEIVLFNTSSTQGQSTSATAFTDTNWHHIVAVYNGTNVLIYVDGVDEDSTPGVLTGPIINTDFFIIGRNSASSAWNGTIDELMILNISLTASQVTDLFNNQSSRFFSTGTQEFQNNNVTEGNTFINVTINSSINFDSIINITVGNVSGSTYDFGDEFSFTNNFASDIPIGTPENISLKFIFYAGNSSTNAFISPTLENDIVIVSFGGEADTTPPSVTINFPTNITYGASDLPFNFNVSLSEEGSVLYSLDDGVNNVTMFDGGSVTGTEFNHTNTSIADGSYTFSAYANDTAGNNNFTESVTFSLDQTFPLITYGTGTEGDGTNFTRTNIYINVSVTETNEDTITFLLHNSTAQVNSTTFTDATRTINFTGLPDETYTFNVTVNDTAGNSNTTATRTVTIDTTIPTINYVSPTETSGIFVSRNYLEVNVTATDSGVGLDTILIRLYNSTQDQINTSSTSTSPNYINFSGLSDGLYFFNATANDTLNNLNNLATRNVTLDTINPSVSIVEPQNISYTTTSLEINFTVSDTNLDSCFYTDDGGVTNITLTNCANTSYTASQGSTTITLYANDTAGNVNGSESVTFSVDSINPDINYVAPTETDGSFISVGAIEINITASDTNLANITIRLYNSTQDEIRNNVSTTSPFNISYTGLSDGIYFFNATARDTFNNINETSTRNVTIDTTTPTMSYVSPTSSDGVFVSRNYIEINITASDTNLQTLEIRLYNSTNDRIELNTSSTSPFYINYSSLSEGVYFYNATANDTAGNSLDLSTRNITLDTTNPAVSSLTESPSDPATYSSGVIYEFNATITDTNIDAVLIEFNGINTTVLDSGGGVYNFTISDLGAGSYDYYWRANDSANNLNITAVQTYTIDRASSEVNLTLNSTESNISIERTTSILLNGTLITGDTGATLRLYNNGTLINEGTTEVSNTTTFNDVGVFNITVIYVQSQNFSQSSETFYVNVTDTVPPIVTINVPENITYTVSTFDFNVTLNEDGGTVLYTLDGGATNITMSSTDDREYNATNSSIADGSYTFRVYANDTFANRNDTAEVTFSIDTTAPSVQVPGGSGGGVFSPLPTITTYLCNKAFNYIGVYGQTNFSGLDFLIEEIEEERNKTETKQTLKSYLSRWQTYCPDKINRTLNEDFVCRRTFYFLVGNGNNYTSLDIRDFNEDKIKDTVKVSDGVLTSYAQNYNSVCIERTRLLLPFSLTTGKPLAFTPFQPFVLSCNSTITSSNDSFLDSLFNSNIKTARYYPNFASCKSIDLLKWIYNIESVGDGNYFVSGLRIWVLIVSFIIAPLSIAVFYSARNRKSIKSFFKRGLR